MPTPHLEEELIRRSREGDLESFNRLVEMYQGQVYSLAFRMLGAAAPAEDATQETFLAAYRNLRSFRGGSFRAWLLRIGTNACYDQLRAAHRTAGASLEAILENPGSHPPSPAPSPEQEALRLELAREIQKAIADLPPDQRSVLVLADIEGLSYEEVAQATGSSLGTVKSRLSRARARVRDYFAQRRELLPGSLRLDR